MFICLREFSSKLANCSFVLPLGVEKVKDISVPRGSPESPSARRTRRNVLQRNLAESPRKSVARARVRAARKDPRAEHWKRGLAGSQMRTTKNTLFVIGCVGERHIWITYAYFMCPKNIRFAACSCMYLH